MITPREEYSFEYFAHNNSFSVHREIELSEDGKSLGRQRVHSMAFLPGMVDELAKYLGDENHPLVSYCNIIWTPDIIKAQEEINRENQGN